MRLSGKLYYDKGGNGQWNGQVLQNNVLYSDASYSGSAIIIGGTGGMSDLRNWGFNDVMSSLRVNPGCSITLYVDINYYGRNTKFTSNVTNLMLFGLNDQASSFILACP